MTREAISTRSAFFRRAGKKLEPALREEAKLIHPIEVYYWLRAILQCARCVLGDYAARFPFRYQRVCTRSETFNKTLGLIKEYTFQRVPLFSEPTSHSRRARATTPKCACALSPAAGGSSILIKIDWQPRKQQKAAQQLFSRRHQTRVEREFRLIDSLRAFFSLNLSIEIQRAHKSSSIAVWLVKNSSRFFAESLWLVAICLTLGLSI
jgi:hypothetical protein